MSDNALCEDGYAYSADQKCCSQNQIQQSPWARFVLPAKAVHENQYGKTSCFWDRNLSLSQNWICLSARTCRTHCRQTVTDVSAWRQTCASNEESGRHACMNAHLTNAAAPNTKCEVIGVRKKIIIVNMGIINVVMYNPVILKKDSPYETEEGCLSLTGSDP